MTSMLWKGEEQQSQAEVRLLETLNSHKCKDTHKPAMGGPRLSTPSFGPKPGRKCIWHKIMHVDRKE